MKEIFKNRWFGLSIFEMGSVILSFLLIVGVALPGFFGALEDLRGKECTNRLRLVAECLNELADRYEVRPGEQICSQFELNDLMMEKQNRARFSIRVGAEPDCADKGDFDVSLILNEDGGIPIPICSLGEDPYYIDHGLHTLAKTEFAWQQERIERFATVKAAEEAARAAAGEAQAEEVAPDTIRLAPGE